MRANKPACVSGLERRQKLILAKRTTLTKGLPSFCFVHATKPSPPPQNTTNTTTWPKVIRSCLPKNTETPMLVKDRTAA